VPLQATGQDDGFGRFTTSSVPRFFAKAQNDLKKGNAFKTHALFIAQNSNKKS
jgi:hypothetical protein